MLKLNTVDYDNLFCYHVPNNTKKTPQNKTKTKKLKQNKKNPQTNLKSAL